MGKSTIEWCDYTFNPWIGCTKVSDGCKNCYAETLMDKRYGRVQWGPQGERVRTSVANWRKPLAWNKKRWWKCLWCGWRGDESELAIDDNMLVSPKAPCPACGHYQLDPTRARVFCASLADVFEEKPDQPEMDSWRAALFEMIQATRNLDWLLLTKRPENVETMIERVTGFSDSEMWFYTAQNTWIGTSVENQQQADKRIPELLKIPAAVRFLSCEPLLSAIDFHSTLPDGHNWGAIGGQFCHRCGGFSWYGEDDVTCPRCYRPARTTHAKIDWVIVGGESGSKARPMHPNWTRSIRAQCEDAGVPFFFKQWGAWLPMQPTNMLYAYLHADTGKRHWHSQLGSWWQPFDGFLAKKIGKKKAGRLLDGKEHNAFPEVQHAP